MRKVVNIAKMLRNEIPSTFVLDTSFFVEKICVEIVNYLPNLITIKV